MKIRVLSDIHLEYKDYLIPDGKEDILVLAGDICPDEKKTMDLIKDYLSRNVDKQVIYILGNHDYYNKSVKTTVDFYRKIHIRNFHFLYNQSVVISGIRFHGTTLWTDMQGMNTNLAEAYIRDYQLIKGWSPGVRIKLHKKAVNELYRLFYTSLEPVVVISHHLPTYRSICPKYRGSPLNPSFASSLDGLIGNCKLWIHGHTHSTLDYYHGDTRVVCNPRGYGDENPEFDPNLIVEI